MGKGDVDIFQLYGKKSYTIKYCGLPLWGRIKFGLAIIRNKKIVFIAKRKLNIILLTRSEIIKKMENAR